MNIQKKILNDKIILFTLAGELDAYAGPELRTALQEVRETDVQGLILDLSQVEYMDSVGLGIIVGAAKWIAERQGQLAVVGPVPHVRRLFAISGTQSLLNVCDTLPEAQERIQGAKETPQRPSEGGA